MSTLRTYNIQNPDSASVNIELTSDGGAVASGILTATTLNATTISGVSTIGVTTATVTTLTVNSNNYPSAGPLSNRNKIINGAMQVAQRGTSATYAGTSQNGGSYNSIDRFGFGSFGTYPSGTYATVEQIAEAPSNSGFVNSLKVTANQTLTVGSSNARGVWIYHILEGYNSVDLLNKDITFSFWVRSSNPGTYSFAIAGTSATAGYATSYVISQANTWEYKTITLTHSDSLYTPNKTNGDALTIYWGLLGDATWIGTATSNQWVSGNIPYLHGTKNFFDTSSATWQITGVQLEVGTVATPFEQRSYGDELAKCQRYCQRFTYFTAPGVVSSSVSTWHPIAFPVAFRAAPSLTVNTLGSVVKEGTAWYANTAINLVNTNVLNGNLNCNQSNNNMVALNATRLGEGCDLTFHAEL